MAGVARELKAATLAGARAVKIVNMSEVYARGSYKGQTKFRVDGQDIDIPLPRQLAAEGLPPYVLDTTYVARHPSGGPPKSAVLQAWGRVGPPVSGGDGGLRDYDLLTATEKRDLANLLSQEAGEAEREKKGSRGGDRSAA